MQTCEYPSNNSNRRYMVLATLQSITNIINRRATIMIINDFDETMQPIYDQYLISMSQMAPSMKTLKLLTTLCRPGDRVIDLGSGFSSFVLRYYAEMLKIIVWSVDDSNSWLEKTRGYCNSKSVDCSRFLTWNDLKSLLGFNTKHFGLVFMDLGTTSRRPAYYPFVFDKLCDDTTTVVIDDMHKPSLLSATDKALTDYDYIEIDIKDQTLDQYGRWCRLVQRLRHKTKGGY